MKPSLDRTAIAGKDVCEQPDNEQYIAIIPEHSLSLTCEHYSSNESGVHLFDAGDKLIASFSPALGWLVIRRDRVELTTREAQIRRLVDNQIAESDLAGKIVKETGKQIVLDCEDPSHKTTSTGQYL